MARVLGLTVPDQFAKDYSAADVNTRVAMLRFIHQDQLVDRAIDQWAQENYGYLGLALKNGEIRKIINQAAREGWNDQRILGALSKTKYWKGHTDAQRKWDTLKSTDPKTAKQQIKDAQGNVSAIAARMGITLGGGAKRLAEHIAKNGITDPAQINRLIAAEAHMGSNLGPGDITAGVSQIKARASEFGVPLTDKGAFDWAKRLADGTASQDGVDEFLRQQSKARFANNKMIQDALGRGQTVRDALDPQIAQVSDLLEIDPDTINLIDPRWSPILEKVDGTDMRVMTSAEAAEFARAQPQWNKTRNAQSSAAAFGEKLLNTFGQVAS
jgi:hypothetical protein